MTDYFTKLHIIWDELENFHLNPVCTCMYLQSCECHCTEKIGKSSHAIFKRS